jgi:hypothetical protein
MQQPNAADGENGLTTSFRRRFQQAVGGSQRPMSKTVNSAYTAVDGLF